MKERADTLSSARNSYQVAQTSTARSSGVLPILKQPLFDAESPVVPELQSLTGRESNAVDHDLCISNNIHGSRGLDNGVPVSAIDGRICELLVDVEDTRSTWDK